jgi:MFS superfamily sulfate permease-like transporter
MPPQPKTHINYLVGIQWIKNLMWRVLKKKKKEMMMMLLKTLLFVVVPICLGVTIGLYYLLPHRYLFC